MRATRSTNKLLSNSGNTVEAKDLLSVEEEQEDRKVPKAVTHDQEEDNPEVRAYVLYF